jgi:aminomethyltransferase
MLDSIYPAVPVGPPPSSRIVTPASISIHSGVEHFEVKGAGAILIPLTTGDNINLRNV